MIEEYPRHPPSPRLRRDHAPAGDIRNIERSHREVSLEVLQENICGSFTLGEETN